MKKIILLLLIVALYFSCSDDVPEYDLTEFRLAEGKTLTYWMSPTNMGSNWRLNMNWTAFYEYFEKVTGIHIEFQHSEMASPENQLEILAARAAAENLPDIIEWNWLSLYPGGIDDAVDDGLILPLQELIMQYAPNFYKTISRNDEISRSVSSVSGRISAFPSLRIDKGTRASGGLLIKQEWLDQLNIAIPTTIDEWRLMLQAMKNTNFGTRGSKPEYPFYFPVFSNYSGNSPLFEGFEESNVFAGSYGVSHGMFFNDNGTVEYGPILSGYLDMLIELNKWYQEGFIYPSLIDPSSDAIEIYAKILAKCGATYGNYEFLSSMGTTIVFEQAPPPILDNNTSRIGGMLLPYNSGYGSAAVSATSRNTELAVRFLDIAYTEWGKTIFNYGIEITHFEYIKGVPVLNDNIIGAPNVWEYSRLLSTWFGPFEQSGALVERIQRGIKNTVDTGDDNPWLIDAVSSPEDMLLYNPKRFEEYSLIMAPITDHARNNFIAFVTGQRSLSEFDSFVSEIENLGVSKAISIINDAYIEFHSKPVY